MKVRSRFESAAKPEHQSGLWSPTAGQTCSFVPHDSRAGKELTGLEELPHPQEAEGDSHDGRFVQMGGDSARQRQSVGELVKHLRLLTPPVSGRVPGAKFPLLRTAPTGGGGRRTGS